MKVVQELTLRVCVTALFIFPALSFAHSRPRPIAARIINIRGETQPEDAVGNVEVTLTNRRREIWTRSWHCELAKVSRTGLVGWTYAAGQHSRGAWMNDELCVARRRKDITHFCVDRAFIDLWGFTENDTCVVIRSGNIHGPSQIEKFLIETGQLVDNCSGSEDPEKTPEWARPYLDEQ